MKSSSWSKLGIGNFHKLPINGFICVHERTQYPLLPGLLTSKDDKRHNKTKKTKQNKTKQSKRQKTRIHDKELMEREKKVLHFLQFFTDIACNPLFASCCNAQRYGDDEGGKTCVFETRSDYNVKLQGCGDDGSDEGDDNGAGNYSCFAFQTIINESMTSFECIFTPWKSMWHLHLVVDVVNFYNK